MASLIDENFSNEPLSLETLPNFQMIELEKVSFKIFKKSLIGFLISLVILVSVFLVLYFLEVLLPVYAFGFIGVVILIFLILILCSQQYIKNYGYKLRQKDIIFKRGLLYKKVTIIPFNRIQHVTIVESFLDKKFNLAQLKIFTAGGSSSDISIPGLTPELSQKIKATIIGKIQDEKFDE